MDFLEKLLNQARQRLAQGSAGAPPTVTKPTTAIPPKLPPKVVAVAPTTPVRPPPILPDRWPSADPAALMRYWATVLSHVDISDFQKKAPVFSITLQQAIDPNINGLVGTNDVLGRDETETEGMLVFVSGQKYDAAHLLGVPVKIRRRAEEVRFAVAAPYLPIFNPAFLSPEVGPKCFAWGEREHADELVFAFAKKHPDTGAQPGWGEYWQSVQRLLCDFLSVKTLEEASEKISRLREAESNTRRSLGFYVEAYIFESSATTKAMREAYGRFNALKFKDGEFALLRTIAGKPRGSPLSEDPTRFVAEHCGHMDEYEPPGKRSLWPLDTTQRRAVRAATQLKHGEVLAVNGPPGSGKTAMLRSLIASQWIYAAASDEWAPCPIVVAVGATNQSVTNVIKAFAKSPHPTNDFSVAARWIPEATSYGAYAPASSVFEKKDELEQFKDYILLRAQRAASPGAFALFRYEGRLDPLNPDRLTEMEQVFLERARQSIKRSPADTIENVHHTCFVQLRAILQVLARELSTDQASGVPLTANTQELIDCRRSRWTDDRIKEVEARIAELKKADGAAGKLLREEIADLTWRPEAFYWACHFWEARFLLAQREILLTRHPKNVEEALRRICMLTPCIVSTFNSLPNLLRTDSNGTIGDPRRLMAESIDLLILDESGQAAPHHAGLAAAYAKRAVAVGDVRQLSPITKIAPASDEILARSAGLSDYPALVRAKRHALGSALSMLRPVSAYHNASKTGPHTNTGLSLLFHYRCVPPIIGYSNELSYRRELRLEKTDKKSPLSLPFMGWVPTATEPVKFRGSWVNKAEVHSIVSWVMEEWPNWVKQYPNKPKYEIVGIVTAYRPQADELEEQITKEFATRHAADPTGPWPTEKEAERIVVGTVHQLQGAECPIVCFSLVEGPEQAAGSFVDRDPALMNVAVSRAQKAFIIFAHPKRLFGSGDEKTKVPVAFLGNYLRTLGADGKRIGSRLFPRKVVVLESPTKRPTLQRLLGRNFDVYATGGSITNLPIGAVDINAGFKPQINLSAAAQRPIENIASAIDGDVDELIVATDDDRMGEYIGWSVVERLRARVQTLPPITRMRLGAITAAAVQSALRHSSSQFIETAICAEAARDTLDALFTDRISLAIGGRGHVGRVMAAVLRTTAELERAQTETVSKLMPALPVKSTSGEKYVIGSLESEITVDRQARLFFRPKNVVRFTQSLPAPAATTLEIMVRAVQRGHAPWECAEALQQLFDGSWNTTARDLNVPSRAAAVVESTGWSGGHPPVHPLDLGLDPSALRLRLTPLQFDVYSVVWDLFQAARGELGTTQKKYEVLSVTVECTVHADPGAPSLGIARFSCASCRDAYKDYCPDGATPGDLADALERAATSPLIVGKAVAGGMQSGAVTAVSLLRTMGRRRLGKPSTYARALKDLSPAFLKWENGTVSLSAQGRNLVAALVEHAPELSNPSTTTYLMEALDRVEDGKMAIEELLASYAPALGWVGDIQTLKSRIWKSTQELSSAIEEASKRSVDAGLIGTTGGGGA